REPAGDHDLLLVAAGEAPGPGLTAGGPDLHVADEARRDPPLALSQQPAVGGDRVEEPDADVLLDAEQLEDRLELALLGHQPDPGPDRVLGSAQTKRPAVHEDLAGVETVGSEDAHGELRAARPGEAPEPADLARAQLEVDVAQDAAREPARLEDDLAGRVGGRRVQVDVLAHHLADEAVLVVLRGRPGRDVAT